MINCILEWFANSLFRQYISGALTQGQPIIAPVPLKLRWRIWLNTLHETTSSTFYWQGLTLIPAWISNYMPSNVWDEITYPFLNFNGATVEV